MLGHLKPNTIFGHLGDYLEFRGGRRRAAAAGPAQQVSARQRTFAKVPAAYDGAGVGSAHSADIHGKADGNAAQRKRGRRSPFVFACGKFESPNIGSPHSQ